ncbi:MAG: nucleotidyl transferase AbiEii/AbiGii toxin family protein [Pyrinomonadaceae bacterium]
MTEKQFYDWQTLGGTDDVMRFVDALEKADVLWCAIGGIAVNHWAAEQMVTLDVDFVVASDSIEKAESTLIAAGFSAEEFDWSINFKGSSKVAIQLTTEDMYRDYASRGIAADVHGILMRVASLEDTLTGKIRAWSDPKRRQSKRFKDLADITRLVESHPQLWDRLPTELQAQIDRPSE